MYNCWSALKTFKRNNARSNNNTKNNNISLILGQIFKTKKSGFAGLFAFFAFY